MDEGSSNDDSRTKEFCKVKDSDWDLKPWDSTSDDWKESHCHRRGSNDEDGPDPQSDACIEWLWSGISAVGCFVRHYWILMFGKGKGEKKKNERWKKERGKERIFIVVLKLFCDDLQSWQPRGWVFDCRSGLPFVFNQSCHSIRYCTGTSLIILPPKQWSRPLSTKSLSSVSLT